MAGELPADWDAELPTYEVGSSQASRVSSKEMIQALSKAIPSLWGGSADLSGSNNTMVAAEKILNLVNMKAATFGSVCGSLRWPQP